MWDTYTYITYLSCLVRHEICIRCYTIFHNDPRVSNERFESSTKTLEALTIELR